MHIVEWFDIRPVSKMHGMVHAVSLGMHQGHQLASLMALKALQPMRLLLPLQLPAHVDRLLSLVSLLHHPMASHPLQRHPTPASPLTLPL